MKRSDVKSGQRVCHDFLGTGDVVQILSREAGLIYVLWDNTPHVDYNTGVNPSVVHAEDLEPDGEWKPE